MRRWDLLGLSLAQWSLLAFLLALGLSLWLLSRSRLE
jgi:disulfide bond formation protein DsbB